jgi:exosortase
MSSQAVKASPLGTFAREVAVVWSQIPNKGLFAAMLLVWILLFQFLGNSTFGYTDTHSLFSWAKYAYDRSLDDEHGKIIPLLVLGFFWWKRKEFVNLTSRIWGWGLLIVVLALLLHLVGYVGQQTRVSMAAFFLGLYGMIGVVWGPAVLKASFFPMCLFAFALPLGTLAESITHPLRMLATTLTTFTASNFFGISVLQKGTQIFSPNGTFQYEVAAACSGLRSLTAVLALCTIYGFMNFKGPGRRLAMVASAFPLAVAGNVLRLLVIIVVAEAYGQEKGQWVHDNSVLSMIPYIPPIVGIVLLGKILNESKAERRDEPAALEQPA